MATIGSLAVNITASTDKLKQGLDKARSLFGSFTESIGGLQTAIAGLAVAGFASVVNGAIEAGGKIYELTQKLHISAEAITALHYAANQLESSSEAVDAALNKMLITLGKAIGGSDQAIGAFNRLGINFQSLQSLSPDKQFLAIVDALHNIPDAATRAASAQAIFGKGAGAIAPLITAGANAIVDMGQKAVENGAVVSTETVQALDDAGDAVNGFKASWEGLKIQMVGTFAPAISGSMWLITETIKILRLAWYDLQYAIVTGAKLLAEAINKVMEVMNLFLPKSMEFDMEQERSLASTLGNQQKILQGKMDAVTGAGGNPLAKPSIVPGQAATGKDAKEAMKNAAADKKAEEKAIADNTKETNAQLKEMVALMKQGYTQNEAAIKVAGVR